MRNYREIGQFFCEIGQFFCEFVLKNPAKLAFSSATCQKPCYRFTQKLLVGIDCVTDNLHFLE